MVGLPSQLNPSEPSGFKQWQDFKQLRDVK
jgi:hypothetical protein